MQYVGLLHLAISLVLTNYEKDNTKLTFLWIIFVFLAFAGNRMCSAVQKSEQINQDTDSTNMFMIIALAVSSLIMLVCALIVPAERRTLVQPAKKSGYPHCFAVLSRDLTTTL